jgi:hypothetical protein
LGKLWGELVDVTLEDMRAVVFPIGKKGYRWSRGLGVKAGSGEGYIRMA